MSIFKKIKQEVNFLEAMEYYIGPLKRCGDDTYTTDEDECPIHGGHGCFRIKDLGEDSIITCFGSCSHDTWPLDIIGFIQVFKELDSQLDAAHLIAKDFNISIPKPPPPNPVQAVLTCAAEYYMRGMMDTSTYACLGGRTPEAYQSEMRHHSVQTLQTAGIGWSNGGLYEHLTLNKFDVTNMIASGLIVTDKNGTKRDYFPRNSFIYTHMWNGRVSRFTFKNMTGKVFQMKKANWLNDIEFYKVGSGNPVAVVEGENDLASMVDVGWEGTIICTNGQLSNSQIKWMSDNPAEYHTFFDPDGAGKGYQEKLWKAKYVGKIPNLRQFQIPEASGDIDNFLKSGSLSDLEELVEPDQTELFDIPVPNTDLEFQEIGGCYYVPRTNAEGYPLSPKPITDFTIELLYVKIRNGERSRVIRIHRMDGKSSLPTVVDSEAKVSIRHFKILIANAIDASFTGSEADLASMWTFVYSNQREAVVEVPEQIGDIEGGGWLFGNIYMTPDEDIAGDEDNIMWLDDRKRVGISPKSLLAALQSTSVSADIPRVDNNDIDIEGEVLYHITSVLKDPGAALTIMGWLKSNAFSMPLYYKAKVKYFPFLLLYGRHGKGKSTLSNWMLNMYDMAEKGTTTVGQLRSGVGIERKLAYYRGLPFCIDELTTITYNISSRIKGTRKSEDVIQVPLNACLFFSGQDVFTDPAMRSRCIPIKFPSNAGDSRSYTWLEDNSDAFSSVGYKWIREAMGRDISEVHDGMRSLQKILSEQVPLGVPGRATGNYAFSGVFAMELAEKYFPKYNYIDYMLSSMAGEYQEAQEGDMVNNFYEMIAGLQIGDHPPLNQNHIMVNKDVMYIWYSEVFRIVSGSAKGDAREGFSRGAVRDALIEEPYCLGDKTVRMGATNISRRCIGFKINEDNTPHEIQSIADTSRSFF